MLTRAQVAKRLGKSIATVRRLEGVALHPVVDANGVHRFEEREVERVAQRGTRGSEREPGAPNPGRSEWLRTQLGRRTSEPAFDEDDGDGEGLDDEDDAREDPEDTARRLREEHVVRREQEVREREQTLAERERRVLERETATSPEREPTAAEALRADPEFRAVMRAQVAQLIGDLDRLPRRVAARVLTEEDVALFEAVLSDEFE